MWLSHREVWIHLFFFWVSASVNTYTDFLSCKPQMTIINHCCPHLLIKLGPHLSGFTVMWGACTLSVRLTLIRSCFGVNLGLTQYCQFSIWLHHSNQLFFVILFLFNFFFFCFDPIKLFALFIKGESAEISSDCLQSYYDWDT